MVSYHLHASLISMCFFPFRLVSHNWHVILGIISVFFFSSSGFSSLGHHPWFYPTLIVCSFGFWTLWGHTRFNLSLMFAPLVSYIWDNILGFSIYVYLLFHHWDTILGSNVCFFFVTFFSQFILCSFRFSLFKGIIRFYLNIIFCSIGLSSLGHHRKFFYELNSLFLWFSSIGHHPRL